MKKFFAVLLVILAGAMPLRADDAADVKAVILKSWTLFAKGDFAEALPLFTKDYRGSYRGKVGYEQAKWMFLGMDGKHPEEFYLFVGWAFKLECYGGTELTPEEVEECRTEARKAMKDPRSVKKYEKDAAEMNAGFRKWAENMLKTHKFISVKVNGDSAVAEFECKFEDNGGFSKSGSVRLRRENGVWRICGDKYE
jgi:hypothetical protein